MSPAALLERAAPGALRNATLGYGFHPSPFGEAIAAFEGDALVGLGWVDDRLASGRAADVGKHAGGREGALADMRRRWPDAVWREDAAGASAVIHAAFAGHGVRVRLAGTEFEWAVWRALVAIPRGFPTTYARLAIDVGRPAAARAVGAAVGKNPVSFLVPCHRVLGKSGALTGYHWGVERKRAILAWEASAQDA